MTTSPIPLTTPSLHTLKQNDIPTFIAYLKALHTAKWPNTVLAQYLELSPTSIANWLKKPTQAPIPSSDSIPPYPLALLSLTPGQSEELHSLALLASQTKKYHTASSPIRQAQVQLEKLLLAYRDKGVSVSELARACKVTRRAIYQRLEKHD
jgi:transcriptional antiterminator